MKLGTLRNGGLDGTLVVVSRDLARAVTVPEIAETLQAALDDWGNAAAKLELVYRRLEEGGVESAFVFDPAQAAAPLPRAYQWLDGSAYLRHHALLRQARGEPMPAEVETLPLMYQGGSAPMLGPRDDITIHDDAWDADLEAELAVVTGAVPAGESATAAAARIALFLLVNDVTLRSLVADELARGFGFLHSKPPTAFAPVAVTQDELEPAWHDGRIHLRVSCEVNGTRLGRPDAGQGMRFGFPELIAHAARTRPLPAGTIIGSGPVSNDAPDAGCCSISERRALETIETGKPQTPYLRSGDRLRIEVRNADGRSVFGAIEQQVVPYYSLP